LEIGEQVGTIRQEPGVGIYGILGAKPRMVPLRVLLNNEPGDKRRNSNTKSRMIRFSHRSW